MYKKLFFGSCFLLPIICSFSTFAQNGTKAFDTLTYQTQSGLPIAASKIYFSDSKFTISGFGESSYTNYLGPKDRGSNDLELYMTNLQRFVTYAAWKPKKWLVVYAEIFAEFANDGGKETAFEYLPEFFLDFLIDEKFNVRVGSHQPQIGFINNNDEPVMFFSVNRPEVERIIIPSQWIDFGIMTYGNLGKGFKWSASLYQGLDPDLNGATWVRRGRDKTLRFNFDSFLFNGGLKYTGLEDAEFAVNGFYTRIGNNQAIITPENQQIHVNATTYLLSSYARYTLNDWTFMALGAYGSMSDTENMFALTSALNQGFGQILGEKVFGYYFEVGYDLAGLLKLRKSGGKESFLLRSNEIKLPIFARYERLDTHAGIAPSLKNEARFQSDLEALTVGLNFNPRRSVVLKTNFQFRNNRMPLSDGNFEGNRFEAGVGFIF